MFSSVIILTPLSSGNSNPHSRLGEIRSKISQAEGAIRDLEYLLTAAILQEAEEEIFKALGITGENDSDLAGLGFDPLDPGGIRHGLYAARAYEGELRTSEQFWQQIVISDRQAQKDTHDLAKAA